MNKKLLRGLVLGGALVLGFSAGGVFAIRCLVGTGRGTTVAAAAPDFPARAADTGRKPGPELAEVVARLVRGDSAEGVSEYLDSGYSPNATNAAGDSFLILAAYNGSTRVIARLLRDPRTAVDATGPRGFTALAGAAFKGDAEILRLLLAAGADPNASGASGRTPLMLAALTGRGGVIRALLAAGADRAARDAQGRDAATVAASQGLEPGRFALSSR